MVAGGGVRLRAANQRAPKYRPASVTAQLATRLCATSVPTSRQIQNTAITIRNIGIPFFRERRGHRNAPVAIHEGRGGTMSDGRAEVRSIGNLQQKVRRDCRTTGTPGRCDPGTRADAIHAIGSPVAPREIGQSQRRVLVS